MATLNTVFADRGTGPNAKALKVKVVAVDDVLNYRKDGQHKSSLKTAVSDGERGLIAVCYDSSIFAIFKEDKCQQRHVRGEDVTLKTVTVEDYTGKAKVTLWRTAADTAARPGDHVLISDVIVNVYQNTTGLQSTSRPKVNTCEAPLEESTVTVEAIGVADGEAELFLENEDIVIIPAELLQDVIGLDKDVELATADGPITLTIQRRGSEVIKVTKI